MCLACPGKIIKIVEPCAQVDFDGVIKKINVQLVNNLKIGDYVNVHAGFAIQKLTKKDASEVLKIYAQ